MNRSQTSTKGRPGTTSPGKMRANGPNVQAVQNAYGTEEGQSSYMVPPQYVD
jgi:hypothetical protein